MKKVTLEELIIEMMPFSKELADWCSKYPKFLMALKNVSAKKFISLGAIVTSYPPTGDEVIGIYTYDYQRKNPIFKQDFVVNKGRLNKEFILFTRNPTGSSKYVKDIKDFFALYGKYGYYVTSHHLALEELPAEIQERGQKAIKLAEKISGTDITKINQEHIDRVYQQVKSVKTGKWYVKQKTKSTEVKNE